MLRSHAQLAIIALALVVTDLITVVRVDTCPDENLPALIGLPLAYRTSIPWVNSMSGVLYVQGVLVNWLGWTALLFLLARIARKQAPSSFLHSRTAIVTRWSITAIAGIAVIFFFVAVEWSWQWDAEMVFRCAEATMAYAEFLR